MSFLGRKVEKMVQKIGLDPVGVVQKDYAQLLQTLYAHLHLTPIDRPPYFHFQGTVGALTYASLKQEEQGPFLASEIQALFVLQTQMDQLRSHAAKACPTGMDSFSNPNSDTAHFLMSQASVMHSWIQKGICDNVETLLFNESPKLQTLGKHILEKADTSIVYASKLLAHAKTRKDVRWTLNYLNQRSLSYQDNVFEQLSNKPFLSAALETWLEDDVHYAMLLEESKPYSALQRTLHLLSFCQSTTQVEMWIKELGDTDKQALHAHTVIHSLMDWMLRTLKNKKIEELETMLERLEDEGFSLLVKAPSVQRQLPQFQFLLNRVNILCPFGEKADRLIQILSKHLSDLPRQDEQGWSALHHSVVAQNVDMVTFLLKLGVNPLLETTQGLRASGLLQTMEQLKSSVKEMESVQINQFSQLMDMLEQAELRFSTPEASKTPAKVRL